MEPIPSLEELSKAERKNLAAKLLREQVLEQRVRLRFWRSITNQAAHIDTGYVGQHLVSLVTGIPGEGFRGKGLDLQDRSEVKAANFLDSSDRRGAVAPRWNFQYNDQESMEALLAFPSIYLVSLDYNPRGLVRARIWNLRPQLHIGFRDRYVEWMHKLGIPKLSAEGRPFANFQLFPPRRNTMETFARHGSRRLFAPLKIELQSPPASTLIFHAEEKPVAGNLNDIEILTLNT